MVLCKKNARLSRLQTNIWTIHLLWYFSRVIIIIIYHTLWCFFSLSKNPSIIQLSGNRHFHAVEGKTQQFTAGRGLFSHPLSHCIRFAPSKQETIFPYEQQRLQFSDTKSFALCLCCISVNEPFFLPFRHLNHTGRCIIKRKSVYVSYQTWLQLLEICFSRGNIQPHRLLERYYSLHTHSSSVAV